MAWLLNKVGLGGPEKDVFPYTVGERMGTVGLWELHACTRRSDGEKLSCLVFDRAANRQQRVDLGLNAFNNMKRLRHPALVHFVDGRETPEKLFVVSEPLRPLNQVLAQLREGHPGQLAWGLHEMARAIQFLNNDCSLVHGYVMTDTIVVNKAGDWKLAGLELISDCSKKDQPLEYHNNLLPDAYKPPELVSGLWINLCKSPRSYDPWLLGCLVSQIFHEGHGGFRGESQLKDMSPVPTGLRDEYKDLLRPYQRRSMENFLGSRFFKDDYVQSMFFLDNIALKDEYEKDQFFKRLQPLIAALPEEVSRFKVLPELVKGLDYGTANYRVLGPILDIGASMEDADYRRLVGQSVVKWFSSPDRSLRRNLLEHLGRIVERADKATVNDKIFPLLADGFEDKSPVLREMTVKAVLILAPHLKPATLEMDVLKHFARLQLDPEPGIRTNTTICLGKIAEYLPEGTRKKVLASAFVRALKDHFPPSKLAGVMSLNATAKYYHVQEIAKKIIPALSHMTIDPDTRVREEAFKAIKHFISVLEAQYLGMSEEQFQKEATRDTTDRTVLDWASGLMGKATSHVTAVAANRVLGTPMPKAQAPPPKYSEDHVAAVAAQVRKDAATPAQKAPLQPGSAPSSSKAQAETWDQALSGGDGGIEPARAPRSQPSTSGGLKLTTAPSKVSAAPVVIDDGWGDDDDDGGWSGEETDDAGWGAVYSKPTSNPTSAPPTPVVKSAPAPVAVKAAPTLGQMKSSAPVQPVFGAKPIPQLVSSGNQWSTTTPAASNSTPTPSVSANLFAPTATPLAKPSNASAPPADAWESFSFGNTSSSSAASGNAADSGWGDLSFLESKPKSSASGDSKKSSKKKKDKK